MIIDVTRYVNVSKYVHLILKCLQV